VIADVAVLEGDLTRLSDGVLGLDGRFFVELFDPFNSDPLPLGDRVRGDDPNEKADILLFTQINGALIFNEMGSAGGEATSKNQPPPAAARGFGKESPEKSVQAEAFDRDEFIFAVVCKPWFEAVGADARGMGSASPGPEREAEERGKGAGGGAR